MTDHEATENNKIIKTPHMNSLTKGIVHLPLAQCSLIWYVYDNNRLLQWFLFCHSRSSMQPQYVDRVRSLLRRLPPAATAEPTKDDNTEVLTEGGVIVLERQESKEKWDTPPSAKNDAGLSSIPWVKQVRLIKNKASKDYEVRYSRRGFCDYMVPDICVNKELEDETLGNLKYERTYKTEDDFINRLAKWVTKKLLILEVLYLPQHK
ncbi:hypothetical protein Tco_0522487 [Tanacetum coccineum]